MNDDWWPVALADALEPGQVLAVPLLGHEHVLWREVAGTLHANDDRCPHRGMRLSYGFVRDARLACAYHGWQFDGTGQCRALPSHPGLAPATTMRVRSHGVTSVDGLIWLASDAVQPAAGHPSGDAPSAEAPSADGVTAPVASADATAPRAGWPEGLAAMPVRSRYLRAEPAAVQAAMATLDLGVPLSAFAATARTGGALSADGARGLGWGLQPTGDGRTGLHVVALARGAVDPGWRLTVSRALRTLSLPA